jgi:hypothetical protein
MLLNPNPTEDGATPAPLVVDVSLFLLLLLLLFSLPFPAYLYMLPPKGDIREDKPYVFQKEQPW